MTSPVPTAPPQFLQSLQPVTAWLAGRPVTPDLAPALQAAFPPGGAVFEQLADRCREGVAQGWLANRGEDPLKWGRALKATDETHGFSVDVVRMSEVAGPHHGHPQGEVDMVIPLDPGARFDGQGSGWKVYGPGSAHAPTVRGGAAIILYLLPGGEIRFTAAS